MPFPPFAEAAPRASGLFLVTASAATAPLGCSRVAVGALRLLSLLSLSSGPSGFLKGPLDREGKTQKTILKGEKYEKRKPNTRNF